MEKLQKSVIKFLKSRARWNSKIQSNAIGDTDENLIVNTSIFGELCAIFLDFKKPLHFKSVEIAGLIETEPILFFEYLCLMKKYATDDYEVAYSDLVETYQALLKDLYKGQPTIRTFSLIVLVSNLSDKKVDDIAKETVHITHDLIENQPKEAIEAVMDMIFFQTNFGTDTSISFDEKTISALETVMVEATKAYDFLFVSRILRTLAYMNAPKSEHAKIAVRFLRKYTPRKINLTLEIFTERGTKKLDLDTEMVQLNKEIMIAMLEWKTDFRMYRDFGKV